MIKHKFDTIRVTQPIGTIYVTKINPSLLLNMSTVDRRRMENQDEFLGIQRELKTEKVSKIKKYLTSNEATFPNSIIVDTKSEFILEETANSLTMRVADNAFTIIDGQHRLEGFRDNPKENFELILAIFTDLNTSQQANIFSTINSEQTKVDPSLNLQLEINSKVYTPKKMMIELAQSFCFDKDSPWYNEIRVLGSKTEGIISLSAFVRPLLEMTYPESDYYLIKNWLEESKKGEEVSNLDYPPDKYVFWEFYLRKDLKTVYKILYNYFKALSVVFPDEWLNRESLLNKTTGYNAVMRLFKQLVRQGVDQGDLSYEFFFNKLRPLSRFNGQINSENYGPSGFKASNELYYDFWNEIENE